VVKERARPGRTQWIGVQPPLLFSNVSLSVLVSSVTSGPSVFIPNLSPTPWRIHGRKCRLFGNLGTDLRQRAQAAPNFPLPIFRWFPAPTPP
jgi:hypothetical protein